MGEAEVIHHEPTRLVAVYAVHAGDCLHEPVATHLLAAVFAEGRAPGPTIDVKTLHAKISELTLENDFLERALTKAGWLSAKR